MKVFCDLHHADLYYSLQLLFEKRLEAELYRPIGLEWYEQGYWNVYPHIDTAKQFLGLNQAIEPPKDIYGNYLSDREQLNKYYRFEDGIYYVRDTTKDKLQRAITLEKFKSMEFDILISSIPQHIQLFNKLIQLYQPKAKHIFQVGNAWGHQQGVKNILASTSTFSVPQNINICFYHQEFDLDVFSYKIPVLHNKIDSYIHYMQGQDLTNIYQQKLECKIYTHGAGMDNCFHKTLDIAKCMQESGWTWHYKPGGDGYGHILYNSFACGRPMIIWKQFYNGKLGNELLKDGKTCVDISVRSIDENIKLIEKLSIPDEHIKISENCFLEFKNKVNFDYEEEGIRKFIERLI